MLGLIIGIAGIGLSKVAVSKYVIRDHYLKTSSEEILVNLDKILAEADTLTYSIKPYAANGTYQLCTAVLSLVDEGEVDPIKARGWMIPMLKATVPTNSIKILLDEMPEAKERPELDDEGKEVFATAREMTFNWDEEKLLLRNVKKYYPALRKLITQADHQVILADPDKSFMFCMIRTFGLFDIVWVLVGMALSFVILTFD
jgi:hypothetical protein